MAPPKGLPESSLIIAPNKSTGNKKRKRPAFRPGQKATKAKANVSSKTKAASVAAVTAVVGNAKSVGAKETSNATTANTPRAVPLVPHASEPTTAPTKALDKDASAVADKVSAPDSKPSNVAETELPKSSMKKPPVSILHGKTKNHTPASTGTKFDAKSTARKEKKKAGSMSKAILPLKSGKKIKSASLILGAHRPRSTGRNQLTESPPLQSQDKNAIEMQQQQQHRHSIANSEEMPALQDATVESTALTTTETEEETYIPPPKEGEVKLGQLCSKFRIKDKNSSAQAKRRKEQEAREKEKKQQHAANDDAREEEPQSAGPVVQIIDGEIVLQESSMVVERGGALGLVSSNHAKANEEDEYAVVEEDADMAVVGASYNSFVSRKNKPQHWTVDETKLFYEALRQVGTDFMLMSEFYPDRDRKQLKKKYQREYSKNAKLVELALHPSQRKPLDLAIFQVKQTEVQEQVEAQKQKEADQAEKAKEDAEEKEQDDKDSSASVEGMTTAASKDDKENEEELIVEDDAIDGRSKPEDSILNDKVDVGASKKGHTVNALAGLSAREVPTEPLWPDAGNQKSQENLFEVAFDEDAVVEEDPMVLEDFQHAGDEVDQIMGHDESAFDPSDEDPVVEKEKPADKGKPAKLPAKAMKSIGKNVIKTAASKASMSKTSKNELSPKRRAQTTSPQDVAAAAEAVHEPALSLVPAASKKKIMKKPKFMKVRPIKKK